MSDESLNLDKGIALTSHEVITLLSLDVSDAVGRARRILKLSGNHETAETVLAGMSTLYVRDLVKIHAGVAAPTNQGRDVARIFAESTRWAQVTVSDDEVTDQLWICESPLGKLLLQKDVLGIFATRRIVTDNIVDTALEHAKQAFAADGSRSLTITVWDGDEPTEVSAAKRDAVFSVAPQGRSEASIVHDSLDSAASALASALSGANQA